MQKNRTPSDSGKHALVPPQRPSNPGASAKISAPDSSKSGLTNLLRGRNLSEQPLYSQMGMEVLPAPREPSSVPPRRSDRIIDVPYEADPESASEQDSWRTHQTFVLQQVVNNIYPELSGSQITVNKGKVLLGSRRVGSLIKKSDGPERIRVWVDQVLTKEQKKAYCSRDDFPTDPKVLGSLLPISAIFGMICSGDCRPLMSAISNMNCASLVTDGFAVRLEFHEKKRADPSESFILKLRV